VGTYAVGGAEQGRHHIRAQTADADGQGRCSVAQLQRVGQRLPEDSRDVVVLCSANCLAGGTIRMFTSPGMKACFPPWSGVLQQEFTLP
jgi:hypothetical protein